MNYTYGDFFMSKFNFKHFIGIFIVTALIATVTIATCQSKFVLSISGANPDYTITMNNETTDDWEFLSKSGYRTDSKTFRYTDFTFEDSIRATTTPKQLQLKGSSGKVYNTTAINGLLSMTINYTSSTKLKAYFGSTINPTTSSFEIVSGTTYDLTSYSNNTYLAIGTGEEYATISSISITYSCVPATAATLTNLEIESLPDKTTYAVGDALNTSGLIINAIYNNGQKINVTDQCTLSIADGELLTTTGSKTITCQYSEGNITLETSFTILVIDSSTASMPDIIMVTNYTDTYSIGDTLDLTNVEVIGMYEDGREVDVTDECTFSMVDGTKLDTAGTFEITCTHVPSGLTDSFTITVVGKAEILEKEETKYDYVDYTRNYIYNTPSMPSSGDNKMLVVPIWFKDSSSFIKSSEKNQIREDINTAYFGEAGSTNLPWHSVKSYYEEESRGKFTLEGTVTDWYNATNYSAKTITSEGVNDLVIEVGDYLKTNLGTSTFNQYDTDKDGYIDALILIYGAPNCSNNSSVSEELWAYCYWIQEINNNVNSPIVNTYFWASYDFMYENRKSNDTTSVDAHTYIHEMGHVLGLSDYYDYAYNYGNNPAAGFSMQDMNVGSHDPFSQMALGWVEPYVPRTSVTIEIQSFQETGDIILLSPDWDGSPFDEYLLLELYTPTGLNEQDVQTAYAGNYPQGPNDVGIRLWHVDARMRGLYKSGNYYYYRSGYYTDIINGNYYSIAMSNTTYVANQGLEGYYADLEEDRNYDLLNLIRNTRANDSEMNDYLSSSMLFKEGDSFSMNEYRSSFYNGTSLNSGSSLGFDFEILDIDKVNCTATIQINKL